MNTEKKEVYKKKTPREHILERPNMYIGASNEVEADEYISVNGKIQKQTVKYVPGLLKIINEIIDNSVDIAIKTDFKGCNLVDVKITDIEVTVSDNGPGIPVEKNTEGEYLPLVCWGYAMSGSNFDDDENRTHLGMNGVGAFCTNVWSTEFTGVSDDGCKRYSVHFKDNALTYKESVKDTREKGVTVRFTPDLERFGVHAIDQVHKDLVLQRLLNLSVCFPAIQFKFNGKLVKTKNFKNYVEMFSDSFEAYQGGNYNFAVVPSPSDEFQSFGYVNGLNIKDGGTHIDVIVNSITQELRESLTRRYKTLKPADIKNKLMIIGVFTGFPNPKFNSQTKEKLTNSMSEVNQYLGGIDYKALAKKILKNKDIVDPIVEVFKIKEELKNRQELKTLNKTKKIKDEHYLPAIKENKYLMIVEGFSASSGLVPSFGREQYGYYCLKGKPLNVWTVSQSKFTANKELSTLYKIIKSTEVEETLKDGDFYKITIDGREMIVNENDDVKIDGKWINVKELL